MKTVFIQFFLLTFLTSHLIGQSDTTFLFDVNNFKLPMDSRGILADVKIGSGNDAFHTGHLGDISILFSGGFAMAGLRPDNEIWGNGVASASRIEDYISGKADGSMEDKSRKIYVVKSIDPAFGDSWLKWSDAVSLGANFYDGDDNGLYEPIDKNSNGIWDEDEDAPDLIGDMTAWCIFNDGVPEDQRRFSQMSPLGIEIKQTVFGYSNDYNDDLANVIFVRCEILNTGLTFDTLSSVMFAPYADPDLGDYSNDLIGSYPDHNLSYVYDLQNELQSNTEITASPSFGITILKGPHTYIANETYNDINANGRFDEGTDIPLSSASILTGNNIPANQIAGAKNLSLTYAMNEFKSHPTFGTPSQADQLFQLLNGKDYTGERVDPCNFPWGEVRGDFDCSSINPNFMFSGNPVSNQGWLCTHGNDMRIWPITGPFDLVKGEKQTIFIAYTSAQGDSSLASVPLLTELAGKVNSFYSNDFKLPVVGIKDNSHLPDEFSLSQNYPNPFNPTTTIEYKIPSSVISNPNEMSGEKSPKISPFGRNDNVQVTLKIYDILGREVTTLIDAKQRPGVYKVEWNATSVSRRISSGVYFYQLRTDNYVRTNKMMLLK
jgi:hypothetical protein